MRLEVLMTICCVVKPIKQTMMEYTSVYLYAQTVGLFLEPKKFSFSVHPNETTFGDRLTSFFYKSDGRTPFLPNLLIFSADLCQNMEDLIKFFEKSPE